MFRVLIAEDEELIREGLKNILDWENLGFEIVYTATDGADAHRYLQKNNVDLIVTDISMPQKNGLELIEEVRKIDKKVRVIILTGYDDFTYARSAIRLDVEDYLLKPINEEELEEQIKNIKKKLEKQKEENTIFSYLRGDKIWENSKELKQQFTFLEQLDIISALILWEGDEEKGREIFAYLRKAYAQQNFTFYYDKKEIYVIYGIRKGQKEDCEQFYFMQNQIEKECSVDTFFTVSTVSEHWYEIKRLYEETQRLKRYKIVKGYGGVLYSSDRKEQVEKEMIVKEEKVKKLLISRDKDGMREYFDHIFGQEIKEEYSLGSIYQSLIEIVFIFQKVIEEFALLHKKIDFVQLIETLSSFENICEIKQHILGVALSIMDEMNTEKKSYTPVISQVLREVEKDLGQTCNLKSLSAKYRVNTSYLGQLFQKEVGVSFPQYVNHLRNEKAKDLILNTNMKINEIALEVGYTESNYFYRKFKQCYGISPNMMRELKCYDKNKE